MRLGGQKVGVLMLGFSVLFGTTMIVRAEDVQNLEREVEEKQAEIESINKRIDEYSARVEQLAQESGSLANDAALIENQMIVAELDMSLTRAQIENQELEITLLETRIEEETGELVRQRYLLSEALFTLYRKEEIGIVDAIFSASDFNELFSQVEQLQDLGRDLQKTLSSTQSLREELNEKKDNRQLRLSSLFDLQYDLEVLFAQLERQQAAKLVLAESAEASEAEYRVLTNELRQERQFVNNEVAQLQAEIQARIRDINPGDDSGLANTTVTWPMDHGIITAVFHDPSYPFRYLFEHSGLDIAVPSGTEVTAAAPGVVAWARTGRSYGNYVMIIHEGGYATLYAHLSRMDVVPDQFVARGQRIALSGNSGFSTGPHLHFEVRLNGIPVNPQDYLTGSFRHSYQ
ncbi:MAG: peptidoglycan DD-metalloendopeptidase family protein [bacterium]|nr:peptidoglycan DD-metalloendopeptidase family protein [bacterium]